MNPQRLFVASCIALLATAMSFAIRGDIMGELELAFGLDKVQLGWISGAAFWGFGLSILFGGTLCDLLGMGRLLKLAAVGHIAGVLLTVFATDFTMLFAATVVIGIANGFVEAGINPLIATLYREQQDRAAGQAARLVPGRHRGRRRARLRLHPARPGLAGQDAADAAAVGDLRDDVLRPAFSRHRTQGGGRFHRCDVRRTQAPAVPGGVRLHVVDRGHRARPGAMGQQHLQRGHAQHAAGRRAAAGVDQRHHVRAATVRRRPGASASRR